MLIFFSSKMEVNDAMEEDSTLWDFFGDVRIWTEDETFANRVVWLDCFGVLPQCWTVENVKKIGEKWGPILEVVQNKGIGSLTHARLRVRTKAQNQIDARVRILFKSGCCEIWVKEVSVCECVSSCVGNKNVVNQVNVDDVEGVNSSKIVEVSESELERNEATLGKEHLVLSTPILSVQRSLEGGIDVVDDVEQIPDPILNHLSADINLVDHVEHFDPITMVEAENGMSNTLIICPNTDPLPYAVLNMERPNPVPICSEVVS
ncbi:unnamed protein product [Amaranthus hypochondriacus]